MTGASQVAVARGTMRVAVARRRRRWIAKTSLALVPVLAVTALIAARHAKPRAADGVTMAQAERADLVQTVSATGSVTAQTGAVVKIGSQITGRIEHLFADVGSQVRAGQVIAELDLPDLAAQVSQAEATLALNQRRLSEQLAGVDLQSIQSRTEIERARAGVATAQTMLRQAQDSANLQVATAEAAVRQAQANATNSNTSLARTEQLFQNGYVAAAAVDDARTQAEVNAAQLVTAQQNMSLTRTKVDSDLACARAQLDQAQAALTAAAAGTAQNAIKQEQVAQARAAVRQSEATAAMARSQLDKSYIRSPISGTVIQLAQQEGETIAAGLSAPTLIIVADLDRLQVDAYVDETDIGQVRVGQPATVTVDAYPNRPFRGRVAKIASGSTMQQNVVTYDVTIALENPGHLLKPDMTATANIVIARRERVLTIPVDALKNSAHGATVAAMTGGPGGKPEFTTVSVRTGISDGDRTEIISGLQDGDSVVVSGQTSQMGDRRREGPPVPGPFGLGGPPGPPPGGGAGGGRGRG